MSNIISPSRAVNRALTIVRSATGEAVCTAPTRADAERSARQLCETFRVSYTALDASRAIVLGFVWSEATRAAVRCYAPIGGAL